MVLSYFANGDKAPGAASARKRSAPTLPRVKRPARDARLTRCPCCPRCSHPLVKAAALRPLAGVVAREVHAVHTLLVKAAAPLLPGGSKCRRPCHAAGSRSRRPQPPPTAAGLVQCGVPVLQGRPSGGPALGALLTQP